jgi:hypothetical protein
MRRKHFSKALVAVRVTTPPVLKEQKKTMMVETGMKRAVMEYLLLQIYSRNLKNFSELMMICRGNLH